MQSQEFTRLGRCALTFFLLCAGAAGVRAQEAAGTGASPQATQRVVGVRIVTESGKVLAENPAGLAVEAGQGYESGAVRDALKALFRSGRYADIRAELENVAGGVRLDFVVRENFYINAVRVEGLREPPGEGRALAALRLGLGEAFREGEMSAALARLNELLREEGFYEASLEYKLSPNETTRQMDVRVGVTPGIRARIGEVTFRGYEEGSVERLQSKSRLRAGKELTTARLERAGDRLRKYLSGRGHLGARVGIRRGEYDAANNRVALEVEISAGPTVRVEVTGTKISGGTLRKLLPIYQEGAVDEDLLQEGRRKIRDHLEREGYFDSQVSFERQTNGNADRHEQVIIYRVERGPRRRLAGIEIEGNQYFSTETIRSRLRIQPASLTSRGRFRRILLREEEDSLRDLYFTNGFRQAAVNAELTEEENGDLRVRFSIEEGAQTLVESLRLEGNVALGEDLLLGVIDYRAGQPYSEANVGSDRDNLLAVYFNSGYPEARFEYETTAAGKPHRMQVVYRIQEGRQFRVKSVLTGGIEETKEFIVGREVQMQPGEPLREGDVLETQRRLYNLGIFNRVAIAPQNPAGSETEKTMIVLVEEARRWTLGLGGGLEFQRLGGGADPVGGGVRASPRGLVELSRGNFTGRAHTLAFKARASALQGRALVSYTAPNFFGRRDWSLLLTGLGDNTRDVRTFTSTRYEASVQLAQLWSARTSLLYRYSFRRVKAESLKISASQVPLFSQPTKISGFGATWIRERRDNPADAALGNFNNLDGSVAAKALGSGAGFVRLFFQNSTFHPIGRELLFARSVRIGIQEPMGDTLTAEIPLPERFFAGGGSSLRGFGLNQAGPRDPQTGFPVGGQALLVFNQELRFPMRLPWLENRLGGAVFYDAGNVYSRASEITLRNKPTAAQTLSGELNYFSHTIGIGFRYGTPIGPVRLDLGYQLNPARFCAPSTVASTACPAGSGLTRLPRFQFFFNIGSIF